MPGKRILMLIGDYSEETTILVFRQAMAALGHRVDIVCPETRAGDSVLTCVEDTPPGARSPFERPGRAVEVTRDFDATVTDPYDALFIPGGRGPEALRTHARIREMVREFHIDAKPILAICRGLQVLAAVPEVIAGRRVAGWYTVETEAILAGARFVSVGPGAALRDGDLVTAEDWTALPGLMRACLELLGTEIRHHPIDAVPGLAAE